jgi:type I restriction enzyme S subunit
MDAATAGLFPADFEESAPGLIPKGWRAATVAEAVEFNPSRSLSKGADAHYLEMANAPTSGHRPTERIGLRAFGSGCKFRNGDALLAKITPCLENGKSAFVDFLDDDEVGWGSTEFIVLRAKPVLPQFGAYLLARHEPFRQFAIQAMTGTSGRQRVELSRLTQFQMALPPDSSIASAATPILRALQSRVAANDGHSKTLAELRDALLPRLVFGKLRLPEAQAQLEEAIA